MAFHRIRAFHVVTAVLLGMAMLSGLPHAWAQRASDISDLLSGEGRVYYGHAPNSIMVVDYPENIARIEEYLKMVDVPPRQVLIEARVVEVKLQGEHALGINWSLFAEKNGYDMGQFLVSGSTVGSAISQDIPYKNTAYPPGSTSAVNENPFTITIFDENINVVVQTLANAFDTNILSAPRVTALNNEEAEIRVVEELRWVTPEVQVEEGTVSITWTEADDSPRDVGISLRVRPMITDDGNILMELHPEVSEHVRDIELTAVAGSIAVPYTIPIVDTRNADTKVVIGNGQTLIIGGLIKDKSTVGESKIPLLGDIPVLGHFFKSSIKSKDKSELLIFVSPTIITPEVTEHMNRMERADGWYLKDQPPPKRRDVPHGVWKKEISVLGLDEAENHGILPLDSKNHARDESSAADDSSDDGDDQMKNDEDTMMRHQEPKDEESLIQIDMSKREEEKNMPINKGVDPAIRDQARAQKDESHEQPQKTAVDKESLQPIAPQALPESVIEAAAGQAKTNEPKAAPLVIEVKAASSGENNATAPQEDKIFHEIEALLKSVKRDIEINKALNRQWEESGSKQRP